MHVSITTKYLSPTDSRGARISVKVHGQTWANSGPSRRCAQIIPYRHDLSADQNHQAAALRVLGTVLGHRQLQVATTEGDRPTERIHSCLTGKFTPLDVAKYSDFWNGYTDNLSADHQVCSQRKWLESFNESQAEVGARLRPLS
jgi:hypothetical protein